MYKLSFVVAAAFACPMQEENEGRRRAGGLWRGLSVEQDFPRFVCEGARTRGRKGARLVASGKRGGGTYRHQDAKCGFHA